MHPHQRAALVAVCCVALMVLTSSPAAAHHGAIHWHQHNRDAGSCCVEVRAHTSCSTNCNYIDSRILKSGTWFTTTCDGGRNDTCFEVYSVWRAYSYPETVKTRHSYDAGLHTVIQHEVSVYYP